MSAAVSGENNPFYGKTHSLEAKTTMMLLRDDRVEVYQYTPEYEYTGNHYMSINELQRALINEGTSRGFRYSTTAPVIDKLTGKLTLPMESRALDPLRGTGSALMSPLQVTHGSSDELFCFVCSYWYYPETNGMTWIQSI